MNTKKNLLSMLFILAIFSCDNSNSEKSILNKNSDNSFNLLVSNINEYNSSFIHENKTRSWFSDFWDDLVEVVVDLVKADAQGAVDSYRSKGLSMNTLYDGIAASISEAIGHENLKISDNVNLEIINSISTTSIDYSKFKIDTTTNDYNKFVLPDKLYPPKTYKEINDIGVLHNKIIRKLVENKESIKNINLKDLEKEIVSITNQMKSEKEISEDFLSNLHININSSYENDLKKDKIKNNYDDIISKISDNSKLEDYAKGFNDIIINSKIKESDKIELLIYTSVASNSKVLWDKN